MGNYLTYDPLGTGVNELLAYASSDVISSILSDIPVAADKVTRVNEEIDASESEVDSYLGAKYSVPLTAPIPDLIRDITAALTAERLYQRSSGVPDYIAERAAVKRRILRDLSSGVSVLPGAAPIPATSTSGYLLTSSEGIIITRDNLTFE